MKSEVTSASWVHLFWCFHMVKLLFSIISIRFRITRFFLYLIIFFPVSNLLYILSIFSLISFHSLPVINLTIHLYIPIHSQPLLYISSIPSASTLSFILHLSILPFILLLYLPSTVNTAPVLPLTSSQFSLTMAPEFHNLQSSSGPAIGPGRTQPNGVPSQLEV